MLEQQDDQLHTLFNIQIINYRFFLNFILIADRKIMEPQKVKQVLIKVQGATLHKITQKQKKKLQEGNCSIIREDGDSFFKINHFTFDFKNVTFGLVQYAKSRSYYFHEEDTQSCFKVLSIAQQENSQQSIDQFHNILSTYSNVRRIDELSQDSQLLKRVKAMYPEYQSKPVQSAFNKLTKITKEFGGFIGSISGLVSKPASKVTDIVENKKQQVYQNRISHQTKSKWETVKTKASSLNQTLSQTMKPVSNKAKLLSSKLGHSFNHSNNSFIKAIRDFGNKTKKALNQGYKQGMGQKNQPQALKTHSQTQTNQDFAS